MDIALRYSASLNGLDIVVDATTADLVREDTLATAVMLSLLCDRTAQAHEVDVGADRRGWWADAYAQAQATDAARDNADAFGSRLWLLAREKQVPEMQQRLRAYAYEALQWLVDDGMVLGLEVTVIIQRTGWYAAMIDLQLQGGNRRFRFEWDGAAQQWHLAGEVQ